MMAWGHHFSITMTPSCFIYEVFVEVFNWLLHSEITLILFRRLIYEWDPWNQLVQYIKQTLTHTVACNGAWVAKSGMTNRLLHKLYNDRRHVVGEPLLNELAIYWQRRYQQSNCTFVEYIVLNYVRRCYNLFYCTITC